MTRFYSKYDHNKTHVFKFGNLLSRQIISEISEIRCEYGTLKFQSQIMNQTTFNPFICELSSIIYVKEQWSIIFVKLNIGCVVLENRDINKLRWVCIRCLIASLTNETVLPSCGRKWSTGTVNRPSCNWQYTIEMVAQKNSKINFILASAKMKCCNFHKLILKTNRLWCHNLYSRMLSRFKLSTTFMAIWCHNVTVFRCISLFVWKRLSKYAHLHLCKFINYLIAQLD